MSLTPKYAERLAFGIACAVLLTVTIVLASLLANRASVPQFVMPVFNSLDELKRSAWSAYLNSVYGSLPNSDAFPLDLSTFQVLFSDKLDAAGITYKQYVDGGSSCPTTHNQLYTDMSGSFDPSTSLFLWKAPPFAAFPSSSRVEVSHCGDDYGNVGAWYYAVKGSGVFLNLGTTIAFRKHADAVRYFLNADCGDMNDECVPKFDAMFQAAAKKGYDTVQFLEHGDQRCGLSAVEIVRTRANGGGKYGCGVLPTTSEPQTTYTRGWDATLPCDCKDDSQTTMSSCLKCSTS